MNEKNPDITAQVFEELGRIYFERQVAVKQIMALQQEIFDIKKEVEKIKGKNAGS